MTNILSSEDIIFIDRIKRNVCMCVYFHVCVLVICMRVCVCVSLLLSDY